MAPLLTSSPDVPTRPAAPAAPRAGADDELELVARLRAGDDDAYAELWRRHQPAGRGAARRLSQTLNPEDVVQEAFVRILAAVRRGNGPVGEFRPYLYAVIRRVASDWGQAQPPQPSVDDVPDQPDARAPREDAMLEQTILQTAFRSLRPEWQETLWYTEVEGLAARELAARLGISANAAAALSYRAREGLRTAWLQAHVNHDAADDGCRATMERLAAHERQVLGRREAARVAEHLRTCEPCASVVRDLHETAGRLPTTADPAERPAPAAGLGAVATTPPATPSSTPSSTAPSTGLGTGLGAARRRPARTARRVHRALVPAGAR
jgi:RNA polymerase sigma factor (sigma-70 family)